jgi:cell division protein FtsI (penicillin-binding protein 3)
MSDDDRSFNPRRLVAILAIFAVWVVIIVARLTQFQIFKHEEYTARANDINEEDKVIPARRGTIYDSQMVALATSVTVNTVVAEPRKMKDIPASAEELAPLLKMDHRALQAKMKDPVRRKYLEVQRQIDPSVARQIQALGIPGISLKDDIMRAYPGRNLASHTLGFVNIDGEGLAGLEKRYNDELCGKPGKAIWEIDALGRSYRERIIDPPVPGRDLVLSIDQHLQYFTERELAAGIKQSRAESGVAIVMESDTGRILALANYPDFNCNTPRQYDKQHWRNLSVQQYYEPGSTFKGITLASTLNEQLTKLDEVIDCKMGSMKVAGQIIHDHEPYGSLTVRQILEFSSNIGAAILGMRLGYDKLQFYLRSFGFGIRTGIDLPAEIVGLVRNKKSSRWSDRSIASISFGQEIAVTPIQMIVAFNVFANGGFRVRPSVVDRILNTKGETIHRTVPECASVISPEVVAKIKDALEGVVLRGTGKLAMLAGYRVAGKTGTAQKAEGRNLSKSKYLASFIGFAPLPHPMVTRQIHLWGRCCSAGFPKDCSGDSSQASSSTG